MKVIHAARTLAAHPVSKIAQENMEVFVNVWEAQVEELGKVLRLITAGGDPSKSKCQADIHSFNPFIFQTITCLLFFLLLENLIFKQIIYYYLYMCNNPNIHLMRKTHRKV